MATQRSHAHTRKTRQSTHDAATELSHANELLQDTIAELKDRGDDAKAVVQEYVHQKPFKALGIAVATGIALALLLKR
jgi:ElaB/YqjD/DUF883 family membrane-anchored ribosome-binding protein